MAWGKAGSTTLSADADTITVDSISNSTFTLGLNHSLASGNIAVYQTYNNDTGNNYAYRVSDNGVEASGTSVAQNYWFKSVNNDKFTVAYIMNISSEEKLSISFTIEEETAGANYSPERREAVFKWANTSDAITRIDVFNTQTGDYLADSNLTAIGSELTPASEEVTLQDGTIFEETDTNKAYIWSSSSKTWTQL